MLLHQTPAAAGLQRRVVSTLVLAQIFGGVGVASGAAVGALLAADLASDSLSGLASASSTIGAAVIAIPVTRLMTNTGRRPGIMLAYIIGICGALLVIGGAYIRFFPLALAGLILAGGGSTATLQSRYAAADLADPRHRGRDLSIVVWATTIGSVAGPNLMDPWGLARLSGSRLTGPYLLAVAAYSIAMTLVGVLLRPDPLLVAREANPEGTATGLRPGQRISMLQATGIIRQSPAATLGLSSVVLGHAVMVAVMSMTPVHLRHGDASLQIIGLVISGHITGMYIASPLVGIAADRIGRRPIVLVGTAILLISFLISGTASGHESGQLMIGLFLLGLGWSCTMVSGSTLLTESIEPAQRPAVQGAADLTMGMGGAFAGLLSGVVVGVGSFAVLNIVAASAIAVLILTVVLERSGALGSASGSAAELQEVEQGAT
ncbi:MAG: MFS transporter [Dehalococcoidia bacterium]|nr:MFS transporter [Dehalococcoidia bacterium]